MKSHSMIHDLCMFPSLFMNYLGRDPDDTEALILAIDYAKVQNEISVDVNGNYQQILDH